LFRNSDEVVCGFIVELLSIGGLFFGVGVRVDELVWGFCCFLGGGEILGFIFFCSVRILLGV